MSEQFFVYIMTNKNNTVLYTGVTNNLIRRVYEHREKLVPAREKQIKAGSRKKKIQLIESMNPEWKDLWAEITDG